MRPPLIVSITTLPSRLGLIRPTLESLLDGDTKPGAIRLILPDKPLRGSDVFVIPDFLGDPDFLQGIIEVVRVERDWGPGTKLLGGLRTITQPSVLVIADDDVRYRRDFLTGLYDAQSADRGASFSYHVWPLGGIDKAQGVDGISNWTPNLAGIEQYFASYVDGTDLMFDDDLWISFFLAAHGIPVRSLDHQLSGSLIYEPVHAVGALVHLQGNLARTHLERWGLRSLMQRVAMPAARHRAIRARGVRRALLGAPRRLWSEGRLALGRARRRLRRTGL